MWISMNGNQGQTFHFARISVKNMHIFFWTADSKRRNTFYIYGNYFYWWWAMASFMWMVFSENQRGFISFIYHTIKAASARESICIDKCLLWKSEFVCQKLLTPQGGEWMYLMQALSIQVSKKLFISDAAIFFRDFWPPPPSIAIGSYGESNIPLKCVTSFMNSPKGRRQRATHPPCFPLSSKFNLLCVDFLKWWLRHAWSWVVILSV